MVNAAPHDPEFKLARRLADLYLDMRGQDPDSDTCILARQFLRACEREERLRYELEVCRHKYMFGGVGEEPVLPVVGSFG